MALLNHSGLDPMKTVFQFARVTRGTRTLRESLEIRKRTPVSIAALTGVR